MASPVTDAKNKAQAQWPGASIHSRGKGWIKHQHPTELTRFILDTQVGGRGWHFGQEPFDESHEVDTAWVISSGQWDWESVKNDFQSYVRDSVPVSYRYVDAETGHFVEITVNGVQWVNDEDDSENAAQFSQVTPTVDDDVLMFGNIAPGWGVDIQAQTGRLAKWLRIDSLANLGSPTIGGTNIRLQMQFTWQKSSGLEVWVDGVQWNEKNNTLVETSGDIEFRDETTQEPVFWFENPKGHDDSVSDSRTAPMVQRVRKTGANFHSEIDTPWSWLQSAIFPISLDDTINPQVDASNEDAFEQFAGNCYPANTDGVVDVVDEWLGFYWDVTIDDGATIDVAYITYQYFHSSVDEANVDIDFDDGAAPAVFTDAGNPNHNISGRTGTTQSINWDDNENVGQDTDQDTPSIVAIIQELVDSYDYSGGSSMVSRWTAAGTAQEDCGYRSWDDNNATAAILHIEFTAGGDIAVTPVVASVIADTVAPSIHLGSATLIPVVASAIVDVIAPAVELGSLVIIPVLADAIADVINPDVIEGGVTVTPVLADAIADVVAPAVELGSMTTTPVFASTIVDTVNPDVELGSLIIIPGVADAIADVIDPDASQDSLSLTPDIADAIVDVVNPEVELASLAIDPVFAGTIVDVVNPGVVIGGETVTPVFASAIVSVVDPGVLYGSVAVTPVFASAITDVVDPTVFIPGIGAGQESKLDISTGINI